MGKNKDSKEALCIDMGRYPGYTVKFEKGTCRRYIYYPTFYFLCKKGKVRNIYSPNNGILFSAKKK